MVSSGLNLVGNVDLNAQPAIKQAEAFGQRLRKIATDGRATTATLQGMSKAMVDSAKAADIERTSLGKLATAQARINALQRESQATAALTRSKADAVTRGASDASGLAATKKQIMLGESMEKITNANIIAQQRLNNEELRGAEITGRTSNAANVAGGRVALTEARAQTEAVRQRVALEESASRINSRANRDAIAQQRLLMSQQRAAAIAAKESAAAQVAAQRAVSSGLTTTRYALQNAAGGAKSFGIAMTLAAVGLTALGAIGQRQITNVVRTTADLSKGPAELAKVTHQIQSEFNALAETLPISYTELTNIGTAAGQLGIKSQNIASFTKTVAQFSATTNVSTDAAATAFGRLDAIVPDVQHNYQGLADSILNVGVNSVATESQIIGITTQISSVAAQAKLGYKDIIGLSGALASIGVAPELSRGTITRVFGDITRAVSEGGNTLTKFGQLTGQTGEQFAKEWQSNPKQALLDFMKGLQESGSNGEAALRSLGITSVRDVPLLLRLANASDTAGKSGGMLAEQFNNANNAAGETARQYALINNTVGAKLQVLLNTIEVALRGIADTDMGPLGTMIDGIQRSVLKFSQSLDKPAELISGLKLPFTNGEALGFIALTAGIVGTLSLLVAGLTRVISVTLAVDAAWGGMSRVLGGSGRGPITALMGIRTAATGVSQSVSGMTASMQTSTGRISGFFSSMTGGAKMADGSFVKLYNSTAAFGGRAPGMFSRVSAGVNKVSDGIAKLGSAFGPELLALGGVALLTFVAQATQAAEKLGSDAESVAATLGRVQVAADALNSINVNKGGFLRTDIEPFVKNMDEFHKGISNLGTDTSLFGTISGQFQDFIGAISGGNTNEGFANMTTGLAKINDGFNQLVSAGKTDDAISGIQRLFKGVSSSDATKALAHMDDVTAQLTLRLQAMGLEVNKTNLAKLLTGALGASAAVTKLATATDTATKAFGGDAAAASDFIDAVNSAYTSALDFNKGYQTVLDQVNATAKKKWVAAGNDVSTFVESAKGNLNDFFATMNKQFENQQAFQGNVAKIMSVIGNEYGKQLESLPPEIVAQVAAGGDSAMKKLQDLLDKQNFGPTIAANMSEFANNPGLYQAFQDAGGKGQAAFSKALTSGQAIDDVIAAMKKKLDSGLAESKALIQIHGDTVPAQKDGESAVDYLNRLQAFIKAHGDTTIARSDFKTAADWANALSIYLKARGDTAPARGDFKNAKDYGDALVAFIKLHGSTQPARIDFKSAQDYASALVAYMQVKGITAPLKGDAETTQAYIDRMVATITLDGDRLPAINAGESAKHYIDRIHGKLTVDGNPAPAMTKGESAAHYINRLRGTIGVDAATDAANTALNWAARDRTATITAHFTGGGGSFARGGPIYGPGTGTSDSVPAMLSNGEYVIRASQAKRFRGLLDNINYLGVAHYATGGQVTQGSAKYEGAATTSHSATVRYVQNNSVTHMTELSPYDRHLLQTIADNIGINIAPAYIAGATSNVNRTQARRGNG